MGGEIVFERHVGKFEAGMVSRPVVGTSENFPSSEAQTTLGFEQALPREYSLDRTH